MGIQPIWQDGTSWGTQVPGALSIRGSLGSAAGPVTAEVGVDVGLSGALRWKGGCEPVTEVGVSLSLRGQSPWWPGLSS